MDAPTAKTGFVIAHRTVTPERGLFGLGSRQLEIPKADRVYRAVDSPQRIGIDLTAKAGKEIASDVPVSFWLLNLGPFRLFLPLDEVIQDGAGHAWNLHLDVQVSVEDPARLMNGGLLALVDEYRPLTPEGLGFWLQERLSTDLQRRLDGESESALRARHGRTMESWQLEITDLLKPWGLIAILMARPEWTSPSAEADAKRREVESARLMAEKAAEEERRVAEERRRNIEEQLAVKERLIAARGEKDAARRAQAEREAGERTQRAMAEAEALKARECNARFAAERAEAEHRVQLAAYESLIRRKELERAELASDIDLVSSRKAQKAEAEGRLRAAEENASRIREDVGEVAAKVAQLLGRAAALGAGTEVLSQSVKSLQVLVQQGDDRTIQRFNLLDGQLQELFQRLDRSIDGGIDDRRKIVGKLEELFTVMGQWDERIGRHIEPALTELRLLGKNIDGQFASVQTAIQGSQQTIVDRLDLTREQVMEALRQLDERVQTLQSLKLDPVAAIAELDGRAILRRYISRPTGVQGFRLQKSNLKKRDLGGLTRDFAGKKKGPTKPPVTGVNMPYVRLGDPVDLQVQTPIRGYLTLINIGTSGLHWLISPHRYVDVPAPIQPGRTYEVPGPELFPRERLWADGYESVGAGEPCGEEGFVAYVTPEPLLRHDDPRLRPAELFWEVPESLLAELDQAFARIADDQKAVGTLRYWVMPEDG